MGKGEYGDREKDLEVCSGPGVERRRTLEKDQEEKGRGRRENVIWGEEQG